MATTRLTDPQKEELVARFSQGEASLALAEAYGVSANTISRVVRAALPPEVYESLKQQRARGTAAVAAASPPSPAEADGASRSRRRRSTAAAETAEQPELPADSAVRVEASSEPLPAIAAAAATTTFAAAGSRRRRSSASSPAADQAGAQAAAAELAPQQETEKEIAAEPKPLAIEDADDFGADALDDEFSGDDTDLDDDDSDDDADFRDADQPFVPVAVSLTPVERREAVICQPLASAGFHGGVYMLVDKTVELQPKALRDFSELGGLPDDEAERQAITVFINPREAKRQCGRSQRVIKMPDASLLERTAPYLLAQGITRVVVEGALYALPGS